MDFHDSMRTLSSAALAALALSLMAQFLAEQLSQPIAVIGAFAQLRLSHNPGIAFSISFPPILQSILIAAALIVVCIVAVRSAKDRLSSVAFGLIIGGAVANLIDRIPDGLVTDFIAVGTFSVFNVADACICIGAGLLLLERIGQRAKKQLIRL